MSMLLFTAWCPCCCLQRLSQHDKFIFRVVHGRSTQHMKTCLTEAVSCDENIASKRAARSGSRVGNVKMQVQTHQVHQILHLLSTVKQGALGPSVMCVCLFACTFTAELWSQEWPLPVREIHLCVCNHGAYVDTRLLLRKKINLSSAPLRCKFISQYIFEKKRL